jgi:hypothetical protein
MIGSASLCQLVQFQEKISQICGEANIQVVLDYHATELPEEDLEQLTVLPVL